MSALNKLQKTRSTIKGTLTRIRNGVGNETTPAEAKVRSKKCEELWNSFQTVQEAIEAIEPKDEEEERKFGEEGEHERETFESCYFETVAALQKIVDEADRVDHNVTQSTAEVNNATRRRERRDNQTRGQKLPEIKLPEFAGELTKWLFFKNSFEATIHNNNQLTNVQKQQYLIGVLQGEARKVIQGFTISEVNYDSAWNLLVDTYDNQMMIIETHLEELFKFPTVSKENKSESLRLLHFHIQTHISSLKAMRQPVQHWDTLVIHLAKKHLDFAEQRDWQERVKDCSPEDMPTLGSFLKFLIERSQSYMLLSQNKYKPAGIKVAARERRQGGKVVLTATQSGCILCGGPHAIYNCEELTKKPSDVRRKILREKGLCLNCLKAGHIARNCRGSRCKRCNRSHNTLLHEEGEQKAEENNEEKHLTSVNYCRRAENAHSSFSVNLAREKKTQILLSTALIFVEDAKGRRVTCRALLDPGSQSNLMTDELRKRLALPSVKRSIHIVGVDNSKAESRGTTRLRLASRDDGFRTEVEFMVLPSITERLPQLEIDINRVVIPEGIQLADPTFNKPGSIDLLIGAGLYWKLIVGEPRNHVAGQPVLQNTRLGFIIGGEVKGNMQRATTTCLKITNEQLAKQIERFWIQETISETPPHTKEEKQCEEMFRDTTLRDYTGRFIVRLPLRPGVTLGESRTQAYKRLQTLWRKLDRQLEIKTAYVDFMGDYQRLGHMTLVEEDPAQDITKSYFIPHQAVLRPDSETTKVRVVFDASAKTSCGPSLNDKLIVGPNLQRDLLHIILRFRSHEFVITSDVEKMFRQILVHPEDRPFQQILWKENSEAPVRAYTLNTVTYGTASAPYHAMKCLDELASLHEDEFPEAARAICNDFYMDDCLSGGGIREEVIRLRQQLQAILLGGGMQLRKWRSNDKGILQGLDDQSDKSLLVLNKEEACKTLGLLWDSNRDCLRFRLELPRQTPQTKREVASKIAQVFDPLGLIAPVLIKGKLLMQLLWADGLEWDQSLT